MVITAQIRFHESPTEEKDLINWKVETEVSNGTNTLKNEVSGINKPHEIVHDQAFNLQEAFHRNVEILFRRTLHKTHSNFSPDNIHRLEMGESPLFNDENRFQLDPEEIAKVRSILEKAETAFPGAAMMSTGAGSELWILPENHYEQELQAYFIRIYVEIEKNPESIFHKFITLSNADRLHTIYETDMKLSVPENADFVKQVASWHRDFVRMQEKKTTPSS